MGHSMTTKALIQKNLGGNKDLDSTPDYTAICLEVGLIYWELHQAPSALPRNLRLSEITLLISPVLMP